MDDVKIYKVQNNLETTTRSTQSPNFACKGFFYHHDKLWAY